MTDITEIRRAGFEVAYAKKYGKQPGRWGMDQEKYRMEHAEVAWWGYNAALDSVVVDLPKPYQNHLDGDVFDADDVIAAIHDAGIKTK